MVLWNLLTFAHFVEISEAPLWLHPCAGSIGLNGPVQGHDDTPFAAANTSSTLRIKRAAHPTAPHATGAWLS
jgi:hypothetical protein